MAARNGTAAAVDRPRGAASYETVALCLQGGGALGAYQGGVYEALEAAGIRPSWVAGISIGAINAALIAGNPPEKRVARLREFWERVSIATTFGAFPAPGTSAADWLGELGVRSFVNFWSASLAALSGQNGFFVPRVPPPWARARGTVAATSFYDTAPLRDTLEALVDFRRLNDGGVRIAVGAVNVETGNFRYFDSARERITAEHIMASGALPPGFPAVDVEGEGLCWDGGLVSNTPLEYVLDTEPRRDTLAFQVDLWSAKGEAPRDLLEVLERQKDIQYSSRTRKGTDRSQRRQDLRHLIADAMDALPPAMRERPAVRALARHACRKVFNVVHVIYAAKAYENHAKDYEFSRATMEEHWTAGRDDMVRSLAVPHVLERPAERGMRTHDVHRADPRAR